MATTKEREYDDREIILRGNEICKLSDLSKEERDLYFSGYDDGHSDGSTFALIIMTIICVVLIVISFIPYKQ